MKKTILLATVLLLSALCAFPSPLRALASTSSPENELEARPSLWIADRDTVIRVDLEEVGQVEVVRFEEPVFLLAADTVRGSVWVARSSSISVLDSRGTVLATFPLPPMGGEPVALQVDELDGSAWLAAGETLLKLHPVFGLIERVEIGSAVTSLALDPKGSRIWVGTQSEVQSRELGEGAYLGKLDTAEPSMVSLATDARRGDLWTSFAGQTHRYDAEGELAMNQPAGGYREMRVAPLGNEEHGVWAIREHRLLYIDSRGSSQTTIAPFGENPLVTMAPDPLTQSIWVSDGSGLARFNRLGWELERYLVGPEAEIRDLAVIATLEDVEAPSLHFAGPRDGETIRGQWPYITLEYADHGSGVDPDTVELFLDSRPVNAQCSRDRERAVCRLRRPLELGGHTLSATVSDFSGNVSPPARIEIQVEETPDEDDDDETAAPDPPPWGQQGYTPRARARGIRRNTPFVTTEGLAAVDTSSGNLTLAIPLGQEYEVGPILKYSFQVVYNSNVWEAHQLCGFEETDLCGGDDSPPFVGPNSVWFSMPNAQSNAGLGWELHFGRLYAPDPPAGISGLQAARWPNREPNNKDENPWMYVAPDGATHLFFEIEDRPAGAWYTQDSSRLRLRRKNGKMEVDFPNGVRSIFEQTGNSGEGTNFCGGGISGCWRLEKMVDPVGYEVTFSYPDATDTTETWTIADSTGRSHTLKFSINTLATRGGDGNGGNWSSPNPWDNSKSDQWGDLRRVLTEVNLAAFDDQTAPYAFSYDKPSLARSCPQQGSLREGVLTTAVLKEITSPGLQPYKIFTEKPLGTNEGCDSMSGKVTKMRTPSRGYLRFEYGNWEHPTICNYSPNAQNGEWTYESLGIRWMHRMNAGNSTAEASWEYKSRLEFGDDHEDGGVLQGPQCQHADRRVTTVVEPLDASRWKKTEIFTSVAQGTVNPTGLEDAAEWRVTDWGLPYDKDQPLDSENPNLFLGRHVYRCTDSNGDNCDPRVRVYYQYANEYRDCEKAAGDRPDCFSRDSIKLRERTVYGDGHYIEQVYQRPDGAGNFDIVSTCSDNHDTRCYGVATNYTVTQEDLDIVSGYVQVGNPSIYLPQADDPWILSLYDKKTTTAHNQASYVKEFEFDNDTGLLSCERTWKESGQRSAHDIVVDLRRGTLTGNRGLPIQEIVSGGDHASLAIADLCDVDSEPAGVRYDIYHEYEHLQLSRSYLPNFPNWYKAVIDRNTGYPSSTVNVADQPTSYEFDMLGRLTSIEPHDSLQEAKTEIVYNNPENEDPTMTETRLMGQTQHYKKITTYDHHGRLEKEDVRRPTGGTTHQATIKTYAYDGPGHLIKESTWRDNESFGISHTVYSDFDILGRPKRIALPDGKVIERDYGAGKKRFFETIKEVRTSEDGFSSAQTRTFLDGLGRPYLIQKIDTPNLYEVESKYDAYGQLIEAKRKGPGIVPQTRYYKHDGRGFLFEECHPELGATGNGCVELRYDAFGQVRERSDDERTLIYGYDNGARPVIVLERLGPNNHRTWKEWSWGQTNDTGNYRRGRIETAVRHNYPIVNGQPVGDYAVHETYVYGGSVANVSRRQTLLRLAGTDEETFSTEFTWTPLGQLASVTYPECATTASNSTRHCDDGGGGDVIGPDLTVTQTYNHDYVRAVTTNLPGDLPRIDLEYADNLRVRKVLYANGTESFYQKDPWGMPRPRKITHKKGSTKYFNRNVYRYDGAGNLWQSGTDFYTYDNAGRLLSAEFLSAGATLSEDYEYDAADNLVSVSTDGGPPQPQNYWGNTNRLSGGANDIQYDAAGNVIAIARLGTGGPRWELTYDAFDMQTSYVENPEGQFLNFLSVYGPGDYRIATLDSLTGERTVTLRGMGSSVLREWNVQGFGPAADWVHKKDYLYGPKGMWASRAQDGEVHYFHRDHLGSTRTITDSNGNKIGRRDYYPYGRDSRDGTGQYDQRMAKYTGHERDPHNLSDYMLARTYAYPLRRFLTPDPARDGWNLYGYVGGNPINAVDPTGKAIFLKTHQVAGEAYHASVVIVPEDQQAFKDDERFETTEDKGVFATLGAGPKGGRLVGEPNRPKDTDLDSAEDLIQLDLGGRDEKKVIEELFSADAQYDDSLDYDFFPAQSGQGSRWLLNRWKDGYNSNSYARGLLESIGLEAPQPTVVVPGYQKPVPPGHFREDR